jgi:hypothetical protein
MRLIDANKLRKEIDKQAYPYRDSTANDIYFSVLHLLADAPTVELVQHGKWEEYEVPHIICCSECDWGTGVDEKHFKYCPNCGAKMDGE